MTGFANTWDIARFVELTDDGSTPNAHKLAQTLQRLESWANNNSDGWAHWPAPSRAAGAIIARLEDFETAWRTGGFVTDLDQRATTAALAPVKAFLTRRHVDDATRALILEGPPPAVPAPPADRVPTHPQAGCQYCERYGRACGRHEPATRYLMVDGEGTVHAEYPEGTRGQWDFSVPPYRGKGFRMVDLKVSPDPRKPAGDLEQVKAVGANVATVGKPTAPPSSSRVMLEAVCGDCAETFVPADENDLEHAAREDGTECGGPGVIVGEWHFTPIHSTSA